MNSCGNVYYILNESAKKYVRKHELGSLRLIVNTLGNKEFRNWQLMPVMLHYITGILMKEPKMSFEKKIVQHSKEKLFLRGWMGETQV